MGPEMITFLSSSLSGILAICVCIINNRYQNSKITALIEYRLTELEKKVDRHNNLIERTYELERRTDVQEEKISVANHRISDLEKGVRND